MPEIAGGGARRGYIGARAVVFPATPGLNPKFPLFTISLIQPLLFLLVHAPLHHPSLPFRLCSLEMLNERGAQGCIS